MPLRPYLPPLTRVGLSVALLYGLTLIVGWRFGVPLSTLFKAALLAPFLAWITVTDLQSFRIPDAASAGIAFIGVAFSLRIAPERLPFDLGMAIALGLLSWAASEGVFRRSGRDVFGLGDCKLLAAATLAVGVDAIFWLILGASLSGIVFALITRQFGTGAKGATIPFGPFIAYAVLLTVLIAGVF